jgi:hypothetical protein
MTPMTAAADRGQAGEGQAIGHRDEELLVAAAEQEPVVGGRRHEQDCRHGRQRQGHEVLDPLSAIQTGEPGRQRRREQEREQHLHAGLDDPHLPQQLDQVAIAALQFGLVATVPRVPQRLALPAMALL